MAKAQFAILFGDRFARHRLINNVHNASHTKFLTVPYVLPKSVTFGAVRYQGENMRMGDCPGAGAIREVPPDTLLAIVYQVLRWPDRTRNIMVP